jgi:hypothetical protein
MSIERVLRELTVNQRNVDLTGVAGTGKSHTTRGVVRHFLDEGKVVVCLAPTGVAALQINGHTIHSAYGIPLDEFPTLPQWIAFMLRGRRTRHARLMSMLIAGAHLLVIDEKSMVSAYLYNLMDVGTRVICRVYDKAFGGKRVLVVGDNLQLDPVYRADKKPMAFQKRRRAEETWSTQPPPEQGLHAFQSPLWACADYVEVRLVTQMRQMKANPVFVDLANRVRESQPLSPEQQRMLKALEVKSDRDIPADAFVIGNTRYLVRNWNDKRLAALPGNEIRIVFPLAKGSRSEDAEGDKKKNTWPKAQWQKKAAAAAAAAAVASEKDDASPLLQGLLKQVRDGLYLEWDDRVQRFKKGIHVITICKLRWKPPKKAEEEEAEGEAEEGKEDAEKEDDIDTLVEGEVRIAKGVRGQVVDWVRVLNAAGPHSGGVNIMPWSLYQTRLAALTDDERNESGYKMLLLVRFDGVDEQVLVLPHTFERSLKLREGRHADLKELEYAAVTCIPLSLGEASTIHRVQGMTLANMRVHGVMENMERYRGAYIIFSRVCEESQLTLSKVPRSFAPCQPVVMAHWNGTYRPPPSDLPAQVVQWLREATHDDTLDDDGVVADEDL